MKIRLLKNHTFGTVKAKKGAEIQTDRATGKSLVKAKIAEEAEFATLKELHVESKVEDEAEEEYIALPLEAKARIIAIKLCTNPIVLKKCLDDERETVKLAAENRIEKLNS